MKTILLLLALTLISCKQDATKNQLGEDLSITAPELLAAMGGKSFRVKLPDNLSKEDFVGLAIRFPDGKIKSYGGGSHYLPNEIVTFVYFNPANSEPYYSILTERGAMQGPFTEESEIMSFADTSIIHSVDDPLIRLSKDNTVTNPDTTPQGDDFDVMIHISKPHEIGTTR